MGTSSNSRAKEVRREGERFSKDLRQRGNRGLISRLYGSSSRDGVFRFHLPSFGPYNPLSFSYEKLPPKPGMATRPYNSAARPYKQGGRELPGDAVSYEIAEILYVAPSAGPGTATSSYERAAFLYGPEAATPKSATSLYEKPAGLYEEAVGRTRGAGGLYGRMTQILVRTVSPLREDGSSYKKTGALYDSAAESCGAAVPGYRSPPKTYGRGVAPQPPRGSARNRYPTQGSVPM